MKFTAIIIIFLMCNVPIFADIFSGKLIDSLTTKPINGAKITYEANYSIKTNTDGLFHINSLKDSIQITISAIGFESKNLILKKNIDTLRLIVMSPKTYNFGQIYVNSGKPLSKVDVLMSDINKIQARQLKYYIGKTLANVLNSELGTSMRTMGTASSRPIIRGLSGHNVTISQDGLPINDLSANSPDHAVATNTFGSNSIDILRGPQVLLYSSTLFGGVININSFDFDNKSQDSYLNSSLSYDSNNDGKSIGIDSKIDLFKTNFSFNFNGLLSNNIRTPSSSLKNTYSKNFSLSIIDYLNFNDMDLGIKLNKYYSEYGIPGGFVGAHPNGVNIKIDKDYFSFPFQFNFNNSILNKLNYTFAYSNYHHTEFEHSGAIGAEFVIKDISNKLALKLNSFSNFTNGELSLAFDQKKSKLGGFVFNPPSINRNLSFAFFQEYNPGNHLIQFGIRYDINSIEPEYEKNSKIGFIRKRDFNYLSASMLIMNHITEEWYLGFSISKASRSPSVEELFSEGPHLAAYSYETGNPELKNENGLGAEIFTYYKTSKLYLMITSYYNYFDYFITTRNTGKINYATLLNIYSHQGVKAKLFGTDINLNYSFNDFFKSLLTFSFTRGINASDNSNLSMIPPMKISHILSFKNQLYTISFKSIYSFKQNFVDSFEKTTSSYFINNSDFAYGFNIGNSVNFLSINIENIFNITYKNHLSRIKSVFPEPGRNFKITYTIMI